jgi:hypothetical protein
VFARRDLKIYQYIINNALQCPHTCNDTKVIIVNASLSTVNTIALPKDSSGSTLLLKSKGAGRRMMATTTPQQC